MSTPPERSPPPILRRLGGMFKASPAAVAAPVRSLLRRASVARRTGAASKAVEEVVAADEEKSELDDMRALQAEAFRLCMLETTNHLAEYLEADSNFVDGRYELWIAELHPENIDEGRLVQTAGVELDHRFYAEDSDHMREWNALARSDGGNRPLVHPKFLNNNNAHEAATTDLLGGELMLPPAEGAPADRFAFTGTEPLSPSSAAAAGDHDTLEARANAPPPPPPPVVPDDPFATAGLINESGFV